MNCSKCGARGVRPVDHRTTGGFTVDTCPECEQIIDSRVHTTTFAGKVLELLWSPPLMFNVHTGEGYTVTLARILANNKKQKVGAYP